MHTNVDNSLPPWSSIRDHFREQAYLGLLLGNGASQAIWPKFAYQSLFKIACDPALSHPLSLVDQAFFREMETCNFESVLSALATTRMVCGHLKKEFGDVEERYSSVRQSLIEAVRAIHVPFKCMTSILKNQLGRILSRYRYIYTTNYDLLPYWSMMEVNDKHKFKDFFWGHENSFDASNAHEWDDDSSRVLYLHGALHLRHDLLGTTRKTVLQEDGPDLLSQFDIQQESIPLFVSEGAYKDKLRSIRRNDYLNFAYWKFCYHRGPLVVFGCSLSSEFDRHILDAIRQWHEYDRTRFNSAVSPRSIAISIFPSTPPSEVIATKNRLIQLLPNCEVMFFDSSTHPLGNTEFQIS